jgi:hypothetical protein
MLAPFLQIAYNNSTSLRVYMFFFQVLHAFQIRLRHIRCNHLDGRAAALDISDN